MIDLIFGNTFNLWILITALIFTIFGRYTKKSDFESKADIVVEFTIDRLIQDGYIKTRTNEDGQVEIIKYNEKL